MAPINFIKRTDFIYISLFYPRDAWHRLLKRAVIPFLNLSSERYGISYVCHLSSFRGEAINFTIFAENDKNDFVLFFHEYFQQYLHDHPASSAREHEEFESVFMDFPTNSIRYGLHDFPFNRSRKLDLNMLLVLQESSAIFLDALSKAGTTSDIMTLALYIYSNLSIQDQMFSKENTWELNGQVKEPQLRDLLDIQYAENKVLVEQVIMDNYNVIHEKQMPGKHRWLTKWSDLSKRLIENRLDNKPSLSPDISKISFTAFVAYAKNQLGLTSDEEVLIRYFVNKALSQSIYTNH